MSNHCVCLVRAFLSRPMERLAGIVLIIPRPTHMSDGNKGVGEVVHDSCPDRKLLPFLPIIGEGRSAVVEVTGGRDVIRPLITPARLSRFEMIEIQSRISTLASSGWILFNSHSRNVAIIFLTPSPLQSIYETYQDPLDSHRDWDHYMPSPSETQPFQGIGQ